MQQIKINIWICVPLIVDLHHDCWSVKVFQPTLICCPGFYFHIMMSQSDVISNHLAFEFVSPPELKRSLVRAIKRVQVSLQSFLPRVGGDDVYITFVAARMMRMMTISTITPIRIIILTFLHQYFLATRVDVLWNESA